MVIVIPAMLGELRTMGGASHALGLVVVGIAAVAWVGVQKIVARWRDLEEHSRWASNARDLVALTGGAALAIGFVLCGLPPAAAILFAGTLGVLLEIVRRGPSRLFQRGAGVVLLALTLAVWPAPALQAANAVSRWLFTVDRGQPSAATPLPPPARSTR